MLSIAPLGSAKGAAAYYAADNYYVDGQLTEASEWAGRGAERLGLKGEVDRETFDALLAGRLPNSVVIADGVRGEHRPGLDLTFSAPKSVSVLAYIGGDDRLLDAHMASVREAISWAQSRMAQTRVPNGRGGQTLVDTGNLVVALFAHDTSRALDPQAHIHAVIANATQTADGQWRALAEKSLWVGKTTIASVYNSSFRQKVQQLGYETVATGHHGQFEVAGVSRDAIRAFSQCRAEIEQEATKLMYNTPAAMAAVTLRTRGEKPKDVDRTILHAEWKGRADAIGFRPEQLVATAVMRGERASEPWQSIVQGIRGIAAQGLALAERLGLIDPKNPNDPLVPERAGRLSPRDFAAAHAVASAVRHLSERESGFQKLDVVKAALDLGPPVEAAAIEHRVAHLIDKGLLISAPDGRVLTTAHAIEAERKFLAELDTGRNASGPLLARDGTRENTQFAQPEVEGDARVALARSAAGAGLKLAKGQSAAGVAILAAADRFALIQGNAGTGKSSMLLPVSRLVEAEGRRVLGLAVSNAIAKRLGSEVGIESMTVARFAYQHAALLDPRASSHQRHAASEKLRGSLVIVDEASMLSVQDATKLLQIANAAGVARVALVGDSRQLGAVEAGKPFAQAQHHAATTVMDQNLRARTAEMRSIHNAAQRHSIGELANLIAPNTVEEANIARATAQRWIGLNGDDRARTSIFVTGRSMQDAINREVQVLRNERGELGGAIRIGQALQVVHLTREQQRHPQSYRAGQVVELSRPLTSQGLPKGRMTIIEAASKGILKVQLEDGRLAPFRPSRLAANRVADAARVFEQRDLMVRVGDPVVFRANDHQRGILNNERAVLAAADIKGATFLKEDGSVLRLLHNDRMLSHVDLAYAMNAHSAQGATSERAILVASSSDGPLLNKSLFAMLFTRARDKVELVTDALDKIERRAMGQTGEKTSAIEIVEPAKAANVIKPTNPLPRPKVPQRELDITQSLGRSRERDFER